MFAKKPSIPDRVGEVVDELIETLSPHVESARDAAAPHVHAAHEKLVKEVLPAVQAAAENAREQAAPMAAEARARGLAATAALKGEEPAAKGGRFKKFVLFAGLAGAVAFAVKKLTGSSGDQPWESSYAPKAPAPVRNEPASQTPIADGVTAKPSTDDPGGSAPGEAIADATDEPHASSTPDAPAEVTEIIDQPNPDRV